MIEVISFAVTAALFAVGRSVVTAALNRPQWPWGTLVVNSIGSLAAGMVVARAPESLSTLLGIAALGAFTTFSTFAVEVLALWSKRRLPAVVYAVSTVVLAVTAAALGLGL